MSQLKERWDLLLFLLMLLLILHWTIPGEARSEEISPQAPRLEEHLDLAALEQQLEQMLTRKESIKDKIEEVERLLIGQEEQHRTQKERVDQLLLAHYLGERDELLELFFSADGFQEMVAIWELMQIVVEYDLHQLEQYQTSYEELEGSKRELLAYQAELQAFEDHYQAQERLLNQLATQYPGSWNHWDDGKRREVLLLALVRHWNDEGTALFQQFFQVLATAMQDIPELITSDHLKANLFQYKLTLTEQELNQFLKGKNPLFQHLHFRFQQGELMVHGSYQDSVLSMRGAYQLLTPSELQFTIHEMIFDGYYLPASTVHAMSERFDLGFYPQQILPTVEIENFAMEPGSLRITLKLNLK